MKRRSFLKGSSTLATGATLASSVSAEKIEETSYTSHIISEIRPENLKKGMIWSKSFGKDVEILFFDGLTDKRIALYLAEEKNYWLPVGM